MRFQLTERQRALRDEVRELAQSEIRPQAIELDQNEAYPREIFSEIGERGYAGITLSEAWGGRGDGLVELAILTEELSAVMMTVASALALNLGVATVIEQFGTDEQKETYLPEMASYERVGALGLSEADAGSNKLEMETTARREGNEWVIDGHKQWVTNFDHADFVLTYAKTGADADAPHDISAFVVPTSAFEVDEVWDTLGARSVKSPRVLLEDVRVPAENMVGEEGEAYRQRSRLHNGVNVPARGVGIARAALTDTVAYTDEREQFDQSIGDFQGVRWNVAKMAQRVDAARLLTLRAADRADRGEDVSREFAMAKVYATEAAVENANDAMQLHGGKGYTTNHHVERYLRDARLLTIAGGPNELHRNALADAVYGG